MGNVGYLKLLPKGGVIKNKRVLAALKKMRLIYNYEKNGRLNVAVIKQEGKYSKLCLLFPQRNAPKQLVSYVNNIENYYEDDDVEIKYLGYKLGEKYLFNGSTFRMEPFLYKI